MTKYTLEDEKEVYINDDMICIKIENKDTDTLILANGSTLTVKK